MTTKTTYVEIKELKPCLKDILMTDSDVRLQELHNKYNIAELLIQIFKWEQMSMQEVIVAVMHYTMYFLEIPRLIL